VTVNDLELTNSSEHKTNVAKDYTERERERERERDTDSGYPFGVFQTLLIKLIGVHIYT
jgi:hypothetical protein